MKIGIPLRSLISERQIAVRSRCSYILSASGSACFFISSIVPFALYTWQISFGPSIKMISDAFSKLNLMSFLIWLKSSLLIQIHLCMSICRCGSAQASLSLQVLQSWSLIIPSNTLFSWGLGNPFIKTVNFISFRFCVCFGIFFICIYISKSILFHGIILFGIRKNPQRTGQWGPK